MIGKPKHKVGDKVSFQFQEETKHGTICFFVVQIYKEC